MKRINRVTINAMALALLISLLGGGVALAHEQRTVGKYNFVVGFLTEPAYSGLPNGLDLRITDKDTQKPVEGLEKTLRAELIFGGKTMPLTVRARFGQPGAYTADLIPTKAGTYIFHISGDIQGQKVDERFESGPGRFNDVQEMTPLQFPEKLFPASDLAAQVQAAQTAASTAQTFGIIGIVVGVLGLAAGGFALFKR
ncbi:MAG: hypothetical protein HZB51_07625 [Chloroflexi bacterium]|nr:hypothetical protein [Chloroflexota bacterium]